MWLMFPQASLTHVSKASLDNPFKHASAAAIMVWEIFITSMFACCGAIISWPVLGQHAANNSDNGQTPRERPREWPRGSHASAILLFWPWRARESLEEPQRAQVSPSGLQRRQWKTQRWRDMILIAHWLLTHWLLIAHSQLTSCSLIGQCEDGHILGHAARTSGN